MVRRDTVGRAFRDGRKSRPEEESTVLPIVVGAILGSPNDVYHQSRQFGTDTLEPATFPRSRGTDRRHRPEPEQPDETPTHESTDPPMDLSRTTKKELREMGWNLMRRKAERPAAVPSQDILHVGEDVIFIEQGDESRLVQLDSER